MKAVHALLVLGLIATTVAADGVPTAPPPRAGIPSIIELMQESHQCRTAYVRVIRAELQKDDPSWGIIETKSRELIQTGKYLALNTPPNGSAESWAKLTTLYTANAVLMTDAAERRNVDETKYHNDKLTRMCANCHRAHR